MSFAGQNFFIRGKAMKYQHPVEARFIDRPNRFIAHVELDGQIETVHVKNTGRCRELLLPGSRVILDRSGNPNRKTAYDLVTVYKENFGWINMDSQAPNQLVAEWLAKQDFNYIKPEYRYGQSRIDFYMEKGADRYLMEVKGCTLEIDGIGYFPDAPTERGVKHLKELAAATSSFKCCLAFVIQMEGIREVFPNEGTDPSFAKALAEAREAGVEVLYLPCRVTTDQVWIE